MYSWNIILSLCAFMLLALLLVVILVLGLRWFKHRERMAVIQRTAAAAELWTEENPEQRRKRQLAGGLTTALVGLALTIGLGTLGIGPWLLAGLIPFFVGLSMILTYLITQPEKRGKTDASETAEHPAGETKAQPEEAGPNAGAEEAELGFGEEEENQEAEGEDAVQGRQ